MKRKEKKNIKTKPKTKCYHLKLGSNLKTLIAAGKMSLTYPPISSAFILECGGIEELKLEQPNKRTNKTKTTLSTYFSSCQRLPWRWRPHLKAPFPLWLRHLEKRLSRKPSAGKWEMRMSRMQFAPGWSSGHIFALTHLHEHLQNLLARTGTSITNEEENSASEEVGIKAAC